ncbi:MAG: hypothetical protein AAGF04_05955 [Chlamydiota bacterium]
MAIGFVSNERLIITSADASGNYQAYLASSDEVFENIQNAAKTQIAKANQATEKIAKDPQNVDEEYEQCQQFKEKERDLEKITGFVMQSFLVEKGLDYGIPFYVGTEKDLSTQVCEHIKYMEGDSLGNAMLVAGLHVCAVALIYFALTPVSLGLAAASIALLAPPVFFPYIYNCLSDPDLEQATRDLKDWKNKVEARKPKNKAVFLENCSNTAKSRKIFYRNCTIIVRGKIETLGNLFPHVSENSKEIYCSKFFRLLSHKMGDYFVKKSLIKT